MSRSHRPIVAGTVLLLNGSSSSGKTTLAKALQQVMEVPLQHIALDQYRDGLPDRIRGLNSPPGTPGATGLNVVPRAVDDELLTHIEFGPVGEQVLRGMRRGIAALANQGVCVVVDDLLFKPEYLADYALVLADLPTYLIGVRCPLAVVDEREAERVGRFPGTARSHFSSVHEHGASYDMEIDTSEGDPVLCAQAVVDYLRRSPPQALAAYRASQVGATTLPQPGL